MASYRPEVMNRNSDERKKGAIRKQYTNNKHRHNDQQQYKEYSRGRYYGDTDREPNRSYNNQHFVYN